VEVPSL